MEVKCNWPQFWAPEESFFGPLQHCLVAVDFKTLIQGRQILIRFMNGYGVQIIQKHWQEWLAEVSIIKFSGSGFKDFDFVWDLSLPDLSWCYSVEELLTLCSQVADLRPIFPRQIAQN
jgi:hypothetical protein